MAIALNFPYYTIEEKETLGTGMEPEKMGDGPVGR